MVPIIVKRREEGGGGGKPSSKINIRPWAAARMKDEIATDKREESGETGWKGSHGGKVVIFSESRPNGTRRLIFRALIATPRIVVRASLSLFLSHFLLLLSLLLSR